jgi:hypothetical protein
VSSTPSKEAPNVGLDTSACFHKGFLDLENVDLRMTVAPQHAVHHHDSGGESATMSGAELALIGSTLLGPIVAVQVSQWLDRARQRRAERFSVFRDLMVTRARGLDNRHIEALNLIDVTFARRRQDRAVREAWRRYHQHLNTKGAYPEQFWFVRRVELLNDLLQALARNLHYNVERSVIESAWYSPEAFNTLDQEQQKVRQGLAKLLDGQGVLPVQIVMPASTQHLQGQQQQPAATPQTASANGAAAPGSG